MFTWLEDIFHGILDLPYILINLLIDAINGWFLILAGFVSLIMSVLPNFPSLPSIAGTPGLELVAYVLPIAEMLGAFGVMLTAWLVWQAYMLIAKKVGMI